MQILGSLLATFKDFQAVTSLVCAELFLVIVRTREITVLVKSDSQRTIVERREVARGLCRSIVLEMCIFIPVSVFLVVVIVRPFLLLLPALSGFRTEPLRSALSGAIGVVSYQFPFATIRKVITQSALKTLQRFASIAIKSE